MSKEAALGFLAGGLQAVDRRVEAEVTADREAAHRRTLEEFRLQKQAELQKLRDQQLSDLRIREMERQQELNSDSTVEEAGLLSETRQQNLFRTYDLVRKKWPDITEEEAWSRSLAIENRGGGAFSNRTPAYGGTAYTVAQLKTTQSDLKETFVPKVTDVFERAFSMLPGLSDARASLEGVDFLSEEYAEQFRLLANRSAAGTKYADQVKDMIRLHDKLRETLKASDKLKGYKDGTVNSTEMEELLQLMEELAEEYANVPFANVEEEPSSEAPSQAGLLGGTGTPPPQGTEDYSSGPSGTPRTMSESEAARRRGIANSGFGG